MPRKPTGKVIKSRTEVPQKNGDIYIYDREYQYDPAIKKTKRISNKLVSKIPKGIGEMVSTRPKRKPSDALSAEDQCEVSKEVSINKLDKLFLISTDCIIPVAVKSVL